MPLQAALARLFSARNGAARSEQLKAGASSCVRAKTTDSAWDVTAASGWRGPCYLGSLSIKSPNPKNQGVHPFGFNVAKHPNTYFFDGPGFTYLSITYHIVCYCRLTNERCRAEHWIPKNHQMTKKPIWRNVQGGHVWCRPAT